MRVERYQNTRFWAVIDASGTLVCLCVYRKGAEEVVRRVQEQEKAQQGQKTSHARESVSR